MNTFEKLLKTMQKRLNFYYSKEKTNLKIMYSFKLTFYLTFIVYTIYLLVKGLPVAVYDKQKHFIFTFGQRNDFIGALGLDVHLFLKPVNFLKRSKNKFFTL